MPTNSQLFDETTFYNQFISDLKLCQSEVIIESPFITSKRIDTYWPIFRKLYDRGVKIYIITRDPKEHNQRYEIQSEIEIRKLEVLGIQVFLCKGNHHRKLAIIDREILWEGSLNILSQIHSREFMHRLEGHGFANKVFNFLKFGEYIN
jgi:phosphatidylserine/phosphatidylglycerophosphate/cardiolipin synthase-like enzyme